MLDRIPMTRIGYDKLKAEVDHLDTVEMPLLSERVAAARSEETSARMLNTTGHVKAKD